jgi:hypothetical protein
MHLPDKGQQLLRFYGRYSNVCQGRRKREADTLYEDDGKTFAYKKGEWMRIEMGWRDDERRLTLRLARGSRASAPPALSYLTAARWPCIYGSTQVKVHRRAAETQRKNLILLCVSTW